MLNEIGTHGKDHTQSGKLKSALTRKQKKIELKGVNKYTVPDLTNFILVTNKSCPVKAEVSNRRYAGITCSDEKIGNKQYFIDLKDAVNPDCVGILLHMLLQRDTSKWVKSNIPKTQAMQDMIDLCLPGPIRFLLDIACLQTDLITEGQLKIHSQDLFTAFVDWSRSKNENPSNERIFLHEIKQIKIKDGPIKIEGVRKRGYIATLDQLRAALKVYIPGDREFDIPDIDD